MEQSTTSGIKKTIFILGALCIMIISFFIGRVSSTPLPTANAIQQSSENPRETQAINKSFSFPVRDGSNKVITNFSYVIQSANIVDQIVVKGQIATAVKGKTFLVITLRLDNPSNQSIEANTRDYIRLTANNNNEALAPEVYNDPVEVQAISTKLTRLGFPINTTDKKLVLHVGEINGEKTNIPLSF